MGTVNKVILIGNLGGDPEIRYTTSGQVVANFTLATTETRVSGDERQEYTEWHKVVAWGRLAEVCREYLSKGRMIYVEGSLRTRLWEDKEGRKRWTTEIFAQNIRMLNPSGQKGEAISEFDKKSSSGFGNDEELPLYNEVPHKEAKVQKKRGSAGEHRAEREQSKKTAVRSN